LTAGTGSRGASAIARSKASAAAGSSQARACAMPRLLAARALRGDFASTSRQKPISVS
jgi:hypothetical protein